jgi:Family of unknown function (DUF5990)
VDVRVVGVELPGRTFDDRRRPDGLLYENVHVGIQHRREVVELVPGDAPRATWDLMVETRRNDGELDFRGPYVQGKRGDRFLYLSWGTVDQQGQFEMFRRAKLMLRAIDDDVVRAASVPGHRLVGTVKLTDSGGCPRCAAVWPPEIAWTVD